MPNIRVLKSTKGRIVKGRFVASNPSKGTKYKKARLKEMIREAYPKKKNAKRKTRKKRSR